MYVYFFKTNLSVVFMVELLAPARDFTALESALQNGANAVYLGLEGYNMRAHTANFTINNLNKAAESLP